MKLNKKYSLSNFSLASFVVALQRQSNAALTGRSGRALAPGRSDPVKRPCPEGALCAPRGEAANEVSAASRARSARDVTGQEARHLWRVSCTRLFTSLYSLDSPEACW